MNLFGWEIKLPWESAEDSADNVVDNISDSFNNLTDEISGSFTALGEKFTEVIGESATSIINNFLDNTMIVVSVAVVGVVCIAAFVAHLLDGKNVELHYTSRSNRRRSKK